jgi:hypothetical protein
MNDPGVYVVPVRFIFCPADRWNVVCFLKGLQPAGNHENGLNSFATSNMSDGFFRRAV